MHSTNRPSLPRQAAPASDSATSSTRSTLGQPAATPRPTRATLRHLPLLELLATARELFENSEYEHAAALYRYVLCWRSRAAAVWLSLARCHEALGQHDVAMRIHEGALRLHGPSGALRLTPATSSESSTLAAGLVQARCGSLNPPQATLPEARRGGR